jgi:DNA-directed RNA polymerase specialized sigma24 family protein
MRDSVTSGRRRPVEAAKSDRNAAGNERGRLTASALDCLLTRLDPDPTRAGERYEELRRRLHGLLRWWGSDNPLELADKVLDRVAMKLEERAPVSREALPGYVRGVARFVFHESIREKQQEELALRDLPAQHGDSESESALASLDVCLDTLLPGDRRLIIDYYAVHRPSTIEARRRLASGLQLSPTALRIRAHRLRQRLEECLAASESADR